MIQIKKLKPNRKIDEIAVVRNSKSERLLFAQSGHHAIEFQCPLSGVQRTSIWRPPMSA